MAIDAIAKGKQRPDDGHHQTAATPWSPIPDPKLGPRHVEIASMYNTERYRPTYDNKLGLPIFLTRA